MTVNESTVSIPVTDVTCLFGEVKLIDGKAVMSDEVAHHLAIFWRKD